MKHLIAFLFIFSVSIASAQHPYFYTINDEDGLPSNEVYQVIQDEFGYMWIGCDAGLFRYDGFNFKGYNHQKQNSRSISNLKLDKNGTIWCQNFTGQIFKVQGDSLIIFYDASEQSKQYPNYTIDKKNQVWITTDSSILVFSSHQKLLKKFENKIFQSKNLTAWVDIYAFKNEIYLLNAIGVLIKFENDFTYSIENISSFLSLRPHFFELKNELYLFTEQNPIRKYYITKFNKPNYEPHEIVLNNTSTIYKLLDCKDQLILGTANGAVILNEKLEKANLSPTLFPENKISYAYKDREGNYWFTSLQDGIFVVPSIDISVFNKSNSVLRDNNISSIAKSKHLNLLVGTYSGEVYELTPNTNDFKIKFESKENKFRAVRKIIEENTNVFIARGQFCKESTNENIIPVLNNTRDFIKINDTIFYTTSDRTGYVVLENGEYKVTILTNKGGKKIAYDSENHIVYFACTNGLFEFKKNHFTEIKYRKESVFASDLLFDQNKLWIATHINGILSHSKNKTISEDKINELLDDLLIKCFDKNNSHWFISNAQGLNCIDLKKYSNRVLNMFDGLAFTEINDIEIIDNQIFLATIKGLVKIPLNISSVNKIAPKIDITKISINGVSKDENRLNIYYKDQIKIDFTSSALRSRGKFHYAYRINNLSEKWNKVSSKSASVNFPSLPPGDYIFEVVAINEDGYQSQVPATLQIHVEGPYWEKWWFILIMAILLVMIVAFIFILRIRYIKEKAITKNRALLSQLKALKAQMNPHFMYNTLNSIQDLIIQNDIKSTNYYLSRFGTLMRLILKASDSNYISIQEEIEILDLYLQLEKLRFGDDFNYSIHLDLKNEIKLQIPSMIIQPYVENALKHGLLHKKGNKNLELSFVEHSHYLEVIIQDNGVGRKKSAEINQRQQRQFESFATKATEMRINLMSEYSKKPYTVEFFDLYENEAAIGTKVVVNIPI